MLLLGVALIVGQILEKHRVEWMSEAGASLIIGILLGLSVTLANNLDYQYSSLFKFNVCSTYMPMRLIGKRVFTSGPSKSLHFETARVPCWMF